MILFANVHDSGEEGGVRKRETVLKRLVIVGDLMAGFSVIHLLCLFLFCNVIWDFMTCYANPLPVLEQ